MPSSAKPGPDEGGISQFEFKSLPNWTADELRSLLLQAAESNDHSINIYLRAGADVNAVDPVTGMTALHFAVGRDNLDTVEMLIHGGAKFVPDKFGRMPSTIAAEMEVSEQLSDLVLEEEAKNVQEE